MPASILKRLNVIICVGHEHSTYSGKKELFLMGDDGNIHKIPCSFGGAGIFLEGINVFAGKEGSFLLSEDNEKWLHMGARLYEKYNAWRNDRRFRPVAVTLSDYVWTPETSIVQPEYNLPFISSQHDAKNLVLSVQSYVPPVKRDLLSKIVSMAKNSPGKTLAAVAMIVCAFFSIKKASKRLSGLHSSSNQQIPNPNNSLVAEPNSL